MQFVIGFHHMFHNGRKLARQKWMCCLVFGMVFAGVIGIVSVGTIKLRHEARTARIKAALSQVRFLILQYETKSKSPLNRVYIDESGNAVSWRLVLASFVYDMPQKDILATSKGVAPDFLRVPDFHQADNSASIVAVVGGDWNGVFTSDVEARWVIAAVPDSGISWTGPNDFTSEDVAKRMRDQRRNRTPILLVTSTGECWQCENGQIKCQNVISESILNRVLFDKDVAR